MKRKSTTSHPKKWIAGAIRRKGSLHRALGISPKRTIPLATLKAHDKGNSRTAKRARLAETLRKLRR